jgi:antitoxin component of MazEF toxin-antitoxin module
LIGQNIVVTIYPEATMTKKLIQHGNSAALVLDKPILQLLNIDLTTELEIVTDGKNLIISPVGSQTSESDLLASLEKVNRQHGRTLERLAK